MSVIAITGAGSGIGAALKHQLQAQGHSVIAIDRANAEVLADLSTPAGRALAVEQTLERCGGVLDGLVCCAGVGVGTSSGGLMVAVNYFGVTQVLDGLLPALAKGQSPSAVVVGSVASVQPGADSSTMVQAMLAGDEQVARADADAAAPHMAYASSKFAVTLHVRRQVETWAEQGVRLNVVAPGAVETPLFQASKDDPVYGESTRKFVAPLGRGSQPDELAAVIVFLLSEQASFMHGSVVFADGGMDARMRPDRF
ncbi:SDR family oxidoreductase [Pseudomonas sp. R5(2019)]|uniref:SDR family oxidoreductase n=1 Tax=Pseudomonas sp. R5(2019) TaxID=2697566 RepID=UPI001413696D|nr:SDR family oxidoreductase [Pseudomonas sp. R5(2019)]NBA97316.1 SDR family oxidoreductase [Pseudomonas sp. R5(2019)]